MTKDKIPTSSKVEFALAMHNFQSILKAQQSVINQIKEVNHEKDVEEGIQEKGNQRPDETEQEGTSQN